MIACILGSSWRLSSLGPSPASSAVRHLFRPTLEPPFSVFVLCALCASAVEFRRPQVGTQSQRSSAILSLNINRRPPRFRLSALALWVLSGLIR
jgi:hypothetical protein